MFEQKRSSLDLGSEDTIDIEEIADRPSRPAPTIEQQEAIMKAGESHGFVSRQPVLKKSRKRSPYVIQKNIKMRMGMSDILATITKKIGASSDQESLEIAIKALIKQESLFDLLTEYQEITK